MNIVIVVPWRADGAERSRNWTALRPHYETLGWPIYECDSGDEPFNRGRSQNQGAKAAGEDWDVMVVLDADVVVSFDVLRAACEQAAETGGLLIPHDNIMTLLDRETETYIAKGNFSLKAGRLRALQPAAGGCHVIPRQLWKRIQYDGETRYRGQDSRLIRWCREHRIPVIRLSGPIVHLYHMRPDRALNITSKHDLIHSVFPGAMPNSADWLKAIRLLKADGRWPF